MGALDTIDSEDQQRDCIRESKHDTAAVEVIRVHETDDDVGRGAVILDLAQKEGEAEEHEEEADRLEGGGRGADEKDPGEAQVKICASDQRRQGHAEDGKERAGKPNAELPAVKPGSGAGTLILEEEPKGELFEVGDQLARPCYAEDEEQGEDPLLACGRVELEGHRGYVFNREEEIAFFVLEDGERDGEDDEEGERRDVGVGHDTLECARTTMSLAPAETSEAVVVPEVEEEEAVEQGGEDGPEQEDGRGASRHDGAGRRERERASGCIKGSEARRREAS